MPEIVTLQVGQCGNQVGYQFWDQLCKEHAIGADGISTADPTIKREDEPRVFFKTNDGKRYTPRSILIDLEPGVISDIKSRTSNGLFDDRNIHVSSSGLGAGNIWSKGYDYSENEKELFLEMIDRELDSCDNLEAFQLFHSIAGGTGSGVGSHLLELLSDRYNKKLTLTYSVFPESGNSSDVVVQPYNSILTLRRLIESSDANVVIENNALRRLAITTFQSNSPNVQQTNQLISTIISSTSNTLRHPGYMYNSLTSIMSTLVPTPDLHFIIPSFFPYTSDYVSDAKHVRKSTGYDIMLELLNKNLKLIDTEDKHQSYLSIFNILQGDIDNRLDVQKAIVKSQARLTFVPWSSSSIHVTFGKKSQHFQTVDSNYASGLMLCNSSSIVSLLGKTCKQFDQIFRKNAFLGGYRDGLLFQENGLDEFKESRESVQRIIEEYKKAELVSYLDDDDEEDEDEELE